jgi:hypothetical protein
MDARESKDVKNRKLIGLMAVSLAVSAAVGIYYYRLSQGRSEISVAGFDLAQVEQRRIVVASGSAAPFVPASSPAPLLGVMPDVRPLTAAAKAAAGARRAGSAAPEKATLEANRLREKEFLAQHGAELMHYELGLGRVTGRYYQTSPVVRSVDAAFGRMDRYMAVKRKYEEDGNPYEFARASIALPEVRAEISRRLADPEVWKVSVMMISDALNNPPPPAVYKEARDFLLEDPQMSDYLKQFTDEAGRNLPPNLAVAPPVRNMGPITKLMQDVSAPPAH